MATGKEWRTEQRRKEGGRGGKKEDNMFVTQTCIVHKKHLMWYWVLIDPGVMNSYALIIP